MKKALLCFFIVFTKVSFAQKNYPSLTTNNFFISAELSKILGASAFDKKYGLSAVYNRILPKSRFGVGIGLELINILTKRLGGIMPGFDVRYYANLGKSTIIPLAQVGYNVYKFQYQKSGTSQAYEEKGGLGYTLGIGYSYSLKPNGSGLFGAFKYRGLQYNYSDPLLQNSRTSERLTLSIGGVFNSTIF
jgi:hypothetical protein